MYTYIHCIHTIKLEKLYKPWNKTIKKRPNIVDACIIKKSNHTLCTLELHMYYICIHYRYVFLIHTPVQDKNYLASLKND